MLKSSKDVFEEVNAAAAEFRTFGQKWVDGDSIADAGRARGYGKKMIARIRAFVEMSIKEEASAKPVAPPVDVVVAAPEEADEAVAAEPAND